MTLPSDEAKIRKAIQTYIKDPSQNNYIRLTYLVLGDYEDSSLFEALVAFTDQRKKTIQGFPFVVKTVVL